MQGFNMGRYVPPDLEGTTSGNRLHGRRAPGTTKRDPDGGRTQTVRFEMPFAVWCHTCRPHALIGQGVRFNAEKRRVGRYLSTPIWSFRLRHPACGGGVIEIRTDPQHTAYVVTAGGKARDYGGGGGGGEGEGDGDDRVREGEGGVPILTPEERARRREDAFAALEGKVEETARAKDGAARIGELYAARERDWDDPWSANRRVRASFREERKARQREAAADEALKSRLGTDLDLLPETAEDVARAKLVDFGPAAAATDADGRMSDHRVGSRALFRTPASSASVARARSSKSAKESRGEALRRQLISNTRAAMNPFGR